MKSRWPSQQTDPFGLVILCVGRTDRLEFREALPALEPWGKVIVARQIDSALSQLAQQSLTPDVIVVVQSRPGEFTDAHIDRLRQAAPLARLIALLGTWCEGEMRTGSPWLGAVRIFWHQWMPHCQRELKRLLAGHESTWSLPPTAYEEERCLTITGRPVEQGSGLVEIVTEQFDVYDWLAAACLDRGYQPRWRRWHDEPLSNLPKVVLFDAAGDCSIELARLRRLHTGRDTPVIVLADFPRCADRDRFVRAGVRAILSRPFFWEDLFWYFTSPPELA